MSATELCSNKTKEKQCSTQCYIISQADRCGNLLKIKHKASQIFPSDLFKNKTKKNSMYVSDGETVFSSTFNIIQVLKSVFYSSS